MSGTKVTFVGLGAMGAGMATCLAKAGVALTVFDLRQSAMDSIALHGAQTSTSAASASQGSDVLILMVINQEQALSVLFDQGALDALKQHATVVLMSTIAPSEATSLAQRITASGNGHRTFIDCPVSGGKPGADSGTLTLMASCPRPIFDAHRDLLGIMGSKLFHVGESAGQGQSMKCVNQVLCAIHLVAAAEAISFAKASGIDPTMALEVTTGSAANSWFLTNRGPRMLQETPSVASATNIIAKDAGIVINAARQMGVALPLTAQALQMINASQGREEGLLDDSQVVRSYDLLNGLRATQVTRQK